MLVTHDPTVASRCSRTLFMHDGVLSLAPTSRPVATSVIPGRQAPISTGTTYLPQLSQDGEARA
ncbi:hypothetical protein [Arthrobacter psychrolactophilus]